jgi:RNA polymerase sigma-70 factor (ECF subfamily)
MPTPEPDRGGVRLASLVEEQLDFVWRVLRRLGMSPVDSEDAAQEVLLVAADKLAEIEPGKERAFLYGVALRVASNARRREVRRRQTQHRKVIADDAATPPEQLVQQPDQRTELARAHLLLDELLSRLPEELARVLILAEIEQCTVPEIAELEQLPVGTAASRLRRARAAFRELLARERHRNPFGAGKS